MTELLALAANLVILFGDAPATVVPYPSIERCETAKRSLLAQAERAKARQRLPSNVPVIRRGIQAYCIPS